jgi:hypothetical protein
VLDSVLDLVVGSLPVPLGVAVEVVVVVDLDLRPVGSRVPAGVLLG